MTSPLTEIRIHGRGGQGNVLAAYVLATAAIDEGQWAQAFPAFGAERRGAPVASFVRMSPIAHSRRCQITQPNFLIIQDETLLHVPSVLSGLQAGSCILVNSTQSADAFSELGSSQAATLAATSLAQEYLGMPVPNTALLAAFLQLTGLLKIESLLTALSHRLNSKQLGQNRALIERVCELMPRAEQPEWKIGLC